MPGIPVSDFIHKISFLERRTGLHVKYRPFEPFPIEPHSRASLQNAAAKMASFLGLRQTLFVVTVEPQRERVSGSVEPDSAGDTFYIEVGPKTASFPEAALATVAHEVTHAYLITRRITLGGSGLEADYENEVLTDVSAVFLGFGKLLLNGSTVQRTYQERIPINDNEWRSRGDTRKVTTTLKVGYLKLSELAFVYLLVCAARGISAAVYESGLSRSSLSALKDCRREFFPYFDPGLRKAEEESLVEPKTLDLIRDAHRTVEELTALLTEMQERYLKPSLDAVHAADLGLKDLAAREGKRASDIGYDPVLRYLDAIEANEDAAHVAAKIATMRSEAENLRSKWTQVLACASRLLTSRNLPGWAARRPWWRFWGK